MNKYIIIDKIDESYEAFLENISKSNLIGVALNGNNVGREGSVSWLQVQMKEMTTILDIVNLGIGVFSKLKIVFESNAIIKVMHDCRSFSEFLWHQCNIILTNVFDTQVADLIVHRAANKNLLPKALSPLYDCILKYVFPPHHQIHGFKTNISTFNESPEKWFERPASESMLKTLQDEVVHLLALRKILLRLMLKDFYDAVQVFQSYYRDIPAAHLLRLKTDKMRVPLQIGQLSKYGEIARTKTIDILLSRDASSKPSPIEDNKEMSEDKTLTNGKVDELQISHSLLQTESSNENLDGLDIPDVFKSSENKQLTNDYCCSGHENQISMTAKTFKKHFNALTSNTRCNQDSENSLHNLLTKEPLVSNDIKKSEQELCEPNRANCLSTNENPSIMNFHSKSWDSYMNEEAIDNNSRDEIHIDANIEVTEKSNSIKENWIKNVRSSLGVDDDEISPGTSVDQIPCFSFLPQQNKELEKLENNNNIKNDIMDALFANDVRLTTIDDHPNKHVNNLVHEMKDCNYKPKEYATDACLDDYHGTNHVDDSINGNKLGQTENSFNCVSSKDNFCESADLTLSRGRGVSMSKHRQDCKEIKGRGKLFDMLNM